MRNDLHGSRRAWFHNACHVVAANVASGLADKAAEGQCQDALQLAGNFPVAFLFG